MEVKWVVEVPGEVTEAGWAEAAKVAAWAVLAEEASTTESLRRRATLARLYRCLAQRLHRCNSCALQAARLPCI